MFAGSAEFVVSDDESWQGTFAFFGDVDGATASGEVVVCDFEVFGFASVLGDLDGGVEGAFDAVAGDGDVFTTFDLYAVVVASAAPLVWIGGEVCVGVEVGVFDGAVAAKDEYRVHYVFDEHVAGGEPVAFDSVDVDGLFDGGERDVLDAHAGVFGGDHGDGAFLFGVAAHDGVFEGHVGCFDADESANVDA